MVEASQVGPLQPHTANCHLNVFWKHFEKSSNDVHFQFSPGTCALGLAFCIWNDLCLVELAVLCRFAQFEYFKYCRSTYGLYYQLHSLWADIFSGLLGTLTRTFFARKQRELMQEVGPDQPDIVKLTSTFCPGDVLDSVLFWGSVKEKHCAASELH